MKNCKCGKEPKVETNHDPNVRQFDGVIRFRAICRECGIKTSFYKSMAQAETAWGIKIKN